MDRYGFTTDQKEAFDILCSGQNVFLTGEAGTGKSYVTDAFLEWCDKTGKSVLALAPTGIAALNLRDGSTIHRGLGIPASALSPDEPLGKPRNVLKEADVIVIDEISMCRIDLFERVARMILDAQRATATKQVVVVGDFFQLPPVVRQDDRELLLTWWPGNYDGYCFSSAYWKGFSFTPCVLRDIVRQQSDPIFASNLNLARSGDSDCVPYFNRHAIKAGSLMDAADESDPEAIWLCPTNRDADRINKERVDALPGKASCFTAKVEGTVNAGDKPTSDKLFLKEGARVMALVNNDESGYYNGSLGTLTSVGKREVEVEFDDGRRCRIGRHEWEITKPTVKKVVDEDGIERSKIIQETIGTFKQLPLRIAYAVTIHKSQGQTFDKAVVGTGVFDAGQLYVGISRCKSFSGLACYPRIQARHLKARQEVIDFYKSLGEEGERFVTMTVPARHLAAMEEFLKLLEAPEEREGAA